MDKILATCLFLLPLFVWAQEERTILLEEAINMATEQSLKSKSVDYQFQSVQLNYLSFRRSYLPAVSLSGTLPSINQSLQPVIQNDGTEDFRRRSQSSYNVGINVSQKIGFTGGTIGLTSNLDGIDQLNDTNSANWSTVPLSLSYSQPLFKFNSMKWELREQPLTNEQAKLEYSENREEVAKQACNLFFNLLSARKTHEMAEQNMNYNDTIFRLSKGRYQMGKIAENELLQIELAKLNSEIRYKQTKLSKDVMNLELCNYLGITNTVDLFPVFEDTVPLIDVNIEKATEMAMTYNSSRKGLDLQLLQGEKGLEQARANRRLNMDLTLSYGLAQQYQGDNPLNTYSEISQDNQAFRVGVNVPITTWGANNALYKAAVINNKKVMADYQIALLNFEKQVFENVNSFIIQKEQLTIARKANEVADKRYFIAQQRYLIGKITTTDLNIATQEREQAQTDYINTVKSYWNSYYDLRKLTHYDFMKNEIIEYNIDME